MNGKDIVGRKFEKSFNGYKIDDVDEFLKEISAEFSALQKDNRELEKKLEVLADKIREYRNDEEALKDALLGAQRQGNSVISEAREKAKNLIEEATLKTEKLIKDAEAENKRIREESENVNREAKENQERIIAQTNEKVAKLEEEMKIKIEINRDILVRTKDEVNEYRQKLIIGYKKQIEIIESFPEQCENEFINKTANDYRKDKNVTLKKQVAKVEEPIQNDEKNEFVEKIIKFDKTHEDIKTSPPNLFEEFNSTKDDKKSISFEIEISGEKEKVIDATEEIKFQPVFEEDNGESENSVEEFVIERNKSEKSGDITEKEPENLFFKKVNHNFPKNGGKLDFGSNAKTIKKK